MLMSLSISFTFSLLSLVNVNNLSSVKSIGVKSNFCIKTLTPIKNANMITTNKNVFVLFINHFFFIVSINLFGFSDFSFKAFFAFLSNFSVAFFAFFSSLLIFSVFLSSFTFYPPSYFTLFLLCIAVIVNNKHVIVNVKNVTVSPMSICPCVYL